MILVLLLISAGMANAAIWNKQPTIIVVITSIMFFGILICQFWDWFGPKPKDIPSDEQ